MVTKIDLLNRTKFIDNMINVTETLSNNKKNACYAINGNWGVGKSFVLEMFTEKMKVKDNFALLSYNCWEYDYYEEPLLAIVVSIIDEIAENKDTISSKYKEKFLGVLKEVGKEVWSKTEQTIEDKTGINVSKVSKIIKDGTEVGDNNYVETRDFDSYINFKKTLKKLKNELIKISEEQTIVFMVDELDRCLPEYSIKVLERLHHIFNDIPNMQIILSTDKLQLEQIVRKIYGEKTDVNKYLAKFIDFELKLEEGTINENFSERFEYYFKNFDYLIDSTRPDEIEEFIKTIFTGLDMRKRIAIIDKCSLLHKILNPDNKAVDYSIMCIEIMLELVNYLKIDTDSGKQSFSLHTLFLQPNEKPNLYNKHGLDCLREKYIEDEKLGTLYYAYNSGEHWIRTNNIWGVVFGCYRIILDYKNDYWHNTLYDKIEVSKYTRKYWEFLHIFK